MEAKRGEEVSQQQTHTQQQLEYEQVGELEGWDVDFRAAAAASESDDAFS